MSIPNFPVTIDREQLWAALASIGIERETLNSVESIHMTARCVTVTVLRTDADGKRYMGQRGSAARATVDIPVRMAAVETLEVSNT